jgi:hypothetical protein
VIVAASRATLTFIGAVAVLAGCQSEPPEVTEARRLYEIDRSYYLPWIKNFNKCIAAVGDAPGATETCLARFPYPREGLVAELRYRDARDVCRRAHPGNKACSPG